jgi:hypothetical protein
LGELFLVGTPENPKLKNWGSGGRRLVAGKIENCMVEDPKYSSSYAES